MSKPESLDERTFWNTAANIIPFVNCWKAMLKKSYLEFIQIKKPDNQKHENEHFLHCQIWQCSFLVNLLLILKDSKSAQFSIEQI